jgi:peptidoglycan/xylan/chitin deacetylase (PgdA/CDA1 family)
MVFPSGWIKTSSTSSSTGTPNPSANHNQSTATSVHSTSILSSNQGNKDIVSRTKILANSSSNKVVMINFDDGYKSQLIYAKPTLDKYGFKASFFIVCGKVATQPLWMNWQDIA